MIKCMIVDDEKPAREELAYLIGQHDGFQVIDQFDEGQKLLLSEAPVDVVFLDINMPKLSGIEVAELLLRRKDSPMIVFVTAYDEFAVKAFEVNAIDYLLKPVSDSRISRTLRKLQDQLEQHQEYNQEIIKLFHEIKRPDKADQVCVHHDGKIFPVKADEIIYVQAENKGALIHTVKGCYMSTMKLKAFEEKFAETSLLRCHRSFIINTDYIEHIEPWFNRTYNVLMKGIKEKIPISRHYVQDFNDAMQIT